MGRISQAMTGSSLPNVVIVLVVITASCDEDLAAPARSAESRSRQDHARANNGESSDSPPVAAPGEDTD